MGKGVHYYTRDGILVVMGAFSFVVSHAQRGIKFILKRIDEHMIEGQVRIPSGCAIAAVISKEGNKMSGEMIYNAMKPMHDRSNGLGGGFADMEYTPNTKISMHRTFFSTAAQPARNCEAFLKEYFEIVKGGAYSHA